MTIAFAELPNRNCRIANWQSAIGSDAQPRRRGTEHKRYEDGMTWKNGAFFFFGGRKERRFRSLPTSIFFNCVRSILILTTPTHHIQHNDEKKSTTRRMRLTAAPVSISVSDMVAWYSKREKVGRLGVNLLCFRLDSVKSECVVWLVDRGCRVAAGAEVDNFSSRKWKFGPRSW